MNEKWKTAFRQWIGGPLHKNPDPAPLAELLRSDEPISQDVRMALAEALNPISPVRANWAVYTKPTGGFDKLINDSIRDVGIFTKVAWGVERRGDVAKAVKELSERHGISKRRVYEIVAAQKDAWVNYWGMSLPSKPKPKRQEPER